MYLSDAVASGKLAANIRVWERPVLPWDSAERAADRRYQARDDLPLSREFRLAGCDSLCDFHV